MSSSIFIDYPAASSVVVPIILIFRPHPLERGKKDFPIKSTLTLNASLRIPLRPSLFLLTSMNVKVDGNSGSCLILLSRSTSSSSWGNLRKASSWISDIKFALKSIVFKLSGTEIRYNKHVRMYFLEVIKKKKANGLFTLQVKCPELDPFLTHYVTALALCM